MNEYLIAVALGGLLLYFVTMPSRIRHRRASGARRSGGGVFGVAEEIFHPTIIEARASLDEQSRFVVPVPSPDGDKGITAGRVRLDAICNGQND